MIEFNINFLFTIINILVLFLLLKKFLFGRVNKILELRQQEIEAEYNKAHEEEAEAQSLKTQYEDTLSDVSALKDRTIKEATELAELKSSKIIDDANERAEEIIKTAHIATVQEHEQMLIDDEKEILELVADALDHVSLNGDGIVADNSALLDEFLKKAGEEV